MDFEFWFVAMSRVSRVSPSTHPVRQSFISSRILLPGRSGDVRSPDVHGRGGAMGRPQSVGVPDPPKNPASIPLSPQAVLPFAS